jgi:hypothetical protein
MTWLRINDDSNNVADGDDLSFAGVAGNNALQALPQLQSMQQHSHYTEFDTPDRHNAAANYRSGCMLDLESTWPSRAHGNESEENVKKRQRT